MNSSYTDELPVLRAHKYEPYTKFTQHPLSCVCIFAGIIVLIIRNSNCKQLFLLLLAKLAFIPSELHCIRMSPYTLQECQSEITVKWFNWASVFYLFKISSCRWCLIELSHNKLLKLAENICLNTAGDIHIYYYLSSITKAFTWTNNAIQRHITLCLWGKNILKLKFPIRGDKAFFPLALS